MKTIKKMLLLFLGLLSFVMFFSSCSVEEKENRLVRESFQSLQQCINDKNATEFKAQFNSVGKSALNESDIEALFEIFPSGVTPCEAPYDDYSQVVDWVEDGNYVKNIYWARRVIENTTETTFCISALECTNDWSNEDLGIIRLIIYPLEKSDEFDIWWGQIDEEKEPNGLILYGT